MAFLFTRTVRYVIFAICLYSVSQYGLRWKSYTISPKVFRTACTAAQGNSGLSCMTKLRTNLRSTYSKHIVDSGWEVIHGGGMTMRINLLYAAPTEFIIVLHAPHTTTGFAGWHWLNSTCTVLSGQVIRTAYSSQSGNKEVFETGKNFRHGEFERHGYQLDADTYLACYGRGAVPVSAIWMATGALANSDPVSFGKLVYAYSHACFHEVSHSVVNTFNYYKNKALKTEL